MGQKILLAVGAALVGVSATLLVQDVNRHLKIRKAFKQLDNNWIYKVSKNWNERD